MNARRDPDQILAAWLEEGANELPASTRRAIAAGVRTTDQARGRFGWPARRNDMTRFQNFGALAAVAIVAMVGVVAVVAVNRPGTGPGGVTAPSPTASAALPSATSATPTGASASPGSPAASPVPLSSFTSDRFGYVIGVPQGWTLTTPVSDLPDQFYPGSEPQYADRWQPAASTVPWVVVAVRDPAPQTPEAWIAANAAAFKAACGASGDAAVTVGGETGTLLIGSCTFGTSTMGVQVVHGTRAYSFEVNYPSQEYATYRALFDQILASVQFTE
jgi:hypothetical protein